MDRINKACAYYPCHEMLEDCVFCYCPLYPCEDEELGKYIGDTKIWDCSLCTWIHEKNRVDKLFEFLNKSIIRHKNENIRTL